MSKPVVVKNVASTGQVYHFTVTMQKADGTDKQMRDWAFIARDNAEAWMQAGKYAHKFMRSPQGRMVTDIQLKLP